MIKYSNYKDSGVDWIGEIPEHWSFLSFRYCIKILTDFTSNGSFASLAKNVEYQSEGYSRLIRLTDLRVNLENDGIYVSEDAHEFLGNSELFGGELLIANVGAYAGLAEIMPELEFKSTLGPNMFLLRLNQFNAFYYYLLNSPLYSKYISEIANSTAQPKLNKENVRTIQVVKPPLPEQQAIVTYLDEKTTLIDDLIKKKQEKIQLLKENRTALINHVVTKGLDPEVEMKDSGVEWIGEVPAHWELKQLKFLTNKIDVETQEKEFLIAVENIEGGTGKLVGMDNVTEFAGSITAFEKGDTIFNKLRPYLAKVYFAEKAGGLYGELLVLRPNRDLYNKFQYYLLSSRGFIEIVNSSTEGTKMPRANWETFIKLMFLPVPPIPEQQQIVTYLDEQTQLIDQTIQQEEQKIELLKEYRQSLISEVVTGKICVLGN